ncbi:MAG: nitroreductase [Pseudomonadota bacterium]
MKVSDALAERRSVRAFLPDPIEKGRLERILVHAARAPSGGNLQPWHVWLMTGNAMVRFRAMMAPRIAQGLSDPPEYPVYPETLKEPYRTRRFAVGEALYARLGIPREDKPARRRWFARNYDFFGAPAAMFLFVDRSMGAAQWSDLGGYLQSVMLLLVEDGLASCPQEAWYLQHAAVQRFLGAPKDSMLFCGLAIGRPDPDADINSLVTARAEAGAWLRHLQD